VIDGGSLILKMDHSFTQLITATSKI